jgi:hypothetical protein
MYDSKQDTKDHIKRVKDLLGKCQIEIYERGMRHDKSKLEQPEKAGFDVATPKLKTLTYGSDEYKEALADLQAVLAHHYASNSHHPEHFDNGVSGMNLFDVIEMLMDWKAATERHADGDIAKSLVVNEGRFGIEPQLAGILRNTAKYLFPDDFPDSPNP